MTCLSSQVEEMWLYELIPLEKILHIDDFVIDECIGEGVYGKVYAATDRANGREVALKFFGYTSNEPREEKIYKEIVMKMHCDHGI